MEWTFERLSSGLWQPGLVGSYFADRGLSGVSGNSGLLRFHDDQSGPIAQRFVDGAFGGIGVRADVFAFDWRARQFAVSTCFDAEGNYTGGGQPGTIVTLDPFDMVTEPWGCGHPQTDELLWLFALAETARMTFDPQSYDEFSWAATLTTGELAVFAAPFVGMVVLNGYAIWVVWRRKYRQQDTLTQVSTTGSG
ncbi:hypothetical protein QSJ19_24235 [Gordonia sp. ABSL11-1]|uniref:hypothetical protein n=1 Tax=Gordonia sp. ABSL11-1 TaxID=3053924 RepID=UPI0025747EEE|nr:hypothetical protein [Gordonia sp. ABSL11-1]MDL9948637.1 hypothetical protein [Gordonia sp. ABSL11-1]